MALAGHVTVGCVVLEADDADRIEQGRLAVAGFAAMVARTDQPGTRKSLKRRPQLRLIGSGAHGGNEEQGLRDFAEQRAGRAVNLLALR